MLFFAQGRCHFRNVSMLFEVGVTLEVLSLRVISEVIKLLKEEVTLEMLFVVRSRCHL